MQALTFERLLATMKMIAMDRRRAKTATPAKVTVTSS
jgi:hypothetical protein